MSLKYNRFTIIKILFNNYIIILIFYIIQISLFTKINNIIRIEL